MEEYGYQVVRTILYLQKCNFPEDKWMEYLLPGFTIRCNFIDPHRLHIQIEVLCGVVHARTSFCRYVEFEIWLPNTTSP